MSANGSIGEPLSSEVQKKFSLYLYMYVHIYIHLHTYTHKNTYTQKKNTSPIKKGGGGKKIKDCLNKNEKITTQGF